MSRTVTKEQLKKSGFGSLRDFMNANKYDADKGKYVNNWCSEIKLLHGIKTSIVSNFGNPIFCVPNLVP